LASKGEKMKRIKILTGFAIAIILTMSFTAFLVSATTLPAITLSASSAQLTIMLPKETTFNGSISTTGTVRFWVNAPNGVQIVNLGLIDKTTAFNFVANQNGNYTMNFENDLTTSIQVTFSYVTNPDLSDAINSTGIPIVYIGISIIIAVLGIIMIIFQTP
jgi:hypothetical protein